MTERLTRPLKPMPQDVSSRLERSGLARRYAARPPYQRNDYLGWIARSKRPQTCEKRIDQLLGELERGDVYMGMAWKGRETQT